MVNSLPIWSQTAVHMTVARLNIVVAVVRQNYTCMLFHANERRLLQFYLVNMALLCHPSEIKKNLQRTKEHKEGRAVYLIKN